MDCTARRISHPIRADHHPRSSHNATSTRRIERYASSALRRTHPPDNGPSRDGRCALGSTSLAPARNRATPARTRASDLVEQHPRTILIAAVLVEAFRSVETSEGCGTPLASGPSVLGSSVAREV